MIASIVILSVLLALSLTWNVIATRRALALDNLLIEGVEALEDSLDELNKAYGTVGKITQSPLASNDPKIVQIHKELKRVHDTLLVVADRLVSSWNKNEQKDTTSEQE